MFPGRRRRPGDQGVGDGVLEMEENEEADADDIHREQDPDVELIR